METEELIKLVDGIYKNILDKFNPGARQMINAGKAYLKALHGAAAASRMYVDAINKLARQAQQGTWGGSSDIGAALMKIVDVYKEIQDQQMNILKAFYVDLLVPLETNLEKDTKVVQSEQKRFLQQHKQRSETYSKAAAMMKKQRKKSRGSTKTGLAMDKELKNMQVLEEEKTKLDAFCEQSLKNAMTQERRRYGFVLERQCSLSKHYLSYYSQGVEAYSKNIEKWSDVAKTREFLPESVENIFSNRLRQITIWQDEDLYSNPRSPNLEDDRMSINSQLRKTKSMDASCLDIRSVTDEGSPVSTLNRAKSEYNLNTSSHSLAQENTPSRRPKSMAVPPPPSWDTQLARALYAYLSCGENQLSFHEGDLIALVGERNKGWQFGENLRTQTSGWFPLAYTEILDDPTLSPSYRGDTSSSTHGNTPVTPTTSNHLTTSAASGNNTLEKPSTRMFGDTLHLNRSSNNAKQIRRAIGSNNIPPPALPAPVPSPSLPYIKSSITQSQSTNFNKSMNMDSSTFQSPYSTTGIKSSGSSYNFSTHPVPSRSDRPTTAVPIPLHMQTKGGPVGNVSLHSSNDSGFSNDPPPQPEVDYSDDESMQGQTKIASRRRILKQLNGDDNNNTMPSPKKTHPIKQSRSHGNLVENKFYMSDDPGVLEKERKRLVKRTKSFWKFGKNSSDNEILEGMALWKHRDLVDIDNDKLMMKTKNTISSHERTRRPSRDKSEDSDRTINNNQNDNGKEVIEKVDKSNNINASNEVKHSKSFSEKQRLSLVPKKHSTEDKNDFDENIYQKNKSHVVDYDDHFYDDEGDGLMLKTVNRKNILQQYTNDSSGTDSETESDMTSDDPYDCIVVEDQNVQKNENHFPNVAELGKKLEKLSKTSKYSPNKDSSSNNLIQEKNRMNTRLDRSLSKRASSIERNEINQYHDKRNINNFKTFGIEIQNNENGEKERIVNDGYYSQTPDKRHNEKISPDKRRFYPDEKNKSKSGGRRNRPSYESIDSDGEQRDDDKRGHDKRNKMMYYDTTNDELTNEIESRQTLPRTKLTKTNSNNSSQSKYENDIGLMDYGETLQRRLKNPEYNSKYDEKSPHNGNMYGPWYDLWGLDSTGPRK